MKKLQPTMKIRVTQIKVDPSGLTLFDQNVQLTCSFTVELEEPSGSDKVYLQLRPWVRYVHDVSHENAPYTVWKGSDLWHCAKQAATGLDEVTIQANLDWFEFLDAKSKVSGNRSLLENVSVLEICLETVAATCPSCGGATCSSNELANNKLFVYKIVVQPVMVQGLLHRKILALDERPRNAYFTYGEIY